MERNYEKIQDRMINSSLSKKIFCHIDENIPKVKNIHE